jgi:hypothetical protein
MAQRQQTFPQIADAIGIEAISQSTQAALGSALSGPQKFAELTSEAMADWMGFVSRRARAQAELYGELSHCHDVDAAAEMQRKFVSRCTKDYSDEFTHLMELGRRNMERMSSLALSGAKQPSSSGKAAE